MITYVMDKLNVNDKNVYSHVFQEPLLVESVNGEDIYVASMSWDMSDDTVFIRTNENEYSDSKIKLE